MMKMECQKLEILNPIIVFDPVLVMDNLVFVEETSEMFSH